MLYKGLKDTYIPTCFGSQRIHHQGVITCTGLKLRIMVQLCLLCLAVCFGLQQRGKIIMCVNKMVEG